MTDCAIVVERVCRLPRDFRLLGTKSVVQLAEEIGLPARRDCVTASAVQSRLQAQPELVDDWLRWSADRRSSPAWYFREDGDGYVVGYHPNGDETRFTDRIRACTQFVLREADAIVAAMAG
jgi:hypothetical protein